MNQYYISAIGYNNNPIFVGYAASEERALRLVENQIEVFQKGEWRIEPISSSDPIYVVVADNGYYTYEWHWEHGRSV